MFEIIKITYKGCIRDKVFLTLLALSIIFFIVIVPSVSSLSMRQVRELSVSFSLSIISFVALVITIFCGVNYIFKDIERRFIYPVLSLPVTRKEYLIGRFLGLLSVIGSALLLLSFFAIIGVMISSSIYQSSIPMLWENYAIAIFTEMLKLMIILSISLLFSTFSTNIFLPLFATIVIYFVGSVTQEIMDYINSPYGQKLSTITIYISKAVYYIFPNLTAFDLKINAIYALPFDLNYIIYLFFYAILYVILVLMLSITIFSKREML